MKITITSTPDIVTVDGVDCRVWQGVTERGTPCVVFVHRVAVHGIQNADEFTRELKETLPPGFYVRWREIL